MTSPIPNNSDENLLLYVNVGGELFYIVIHRMEVQGIEPHLQNTVAQQLILALASTDILRDVTTGRLRFCDQKLDALRSVLKELVDGTIMKINDFSMEKLFELTLIATKYQYTVAAHPKDILLIALNHVDSLRRFAHERAGLDLTEKLHNLLVETFGGKSSQEMGMYRWQILHYLDDVKLKMTNLVNLGLQDQNGEFVRTEAEELVHPEEEDIETLDGGRKRERRRMHSLELNGDRVITLGLSIYIQRNQFNQKTPPIEAESPPNFASVSSAELQFGEDCAKAVQGLDFCSVLLRGTDSARKPANHKIDNLSTLAQIQKQGTQTIRIDANAVRCSTNQALIEIGRKLEETELGDADTEKVGSRKMDLSQLFDMFAD